MPFEVAPVQLMSTEVIRDMSNRLSVLSCVRALKQNPDGEQRNSRQD
jgi:hypothetical protein